MRRRMLEGKNYIALDEVFPFVVVFIDRRTEHEKIAPMTMVHTPYTVTVTIVTGDLGN